MIYKRNANKPLFYCYSEHAPSGNFYRGLRLYLPRRPRPSLFFFLSPRVARRDLSRSYSLLRPLLPR